MNVVTREDVRVTVDGGAEIGAHVALSEAGDGRPAVMVLGEIWGLNDHIRTLCDRLAAAGCIAIAPDQYRGLPPPQETDPTSTVLGFFDRFDDPLGIRDARAVVDHVLNGDLGVRPGRLYVLGFCMGGRFAHYLAAVDPRLAGAINFYGRLSFARDARRKPFTPLDVAGLVACPYLGLFGEIDDFIPRADVEALGRELATRGVPHHLEIYAGAHHAFLNETHASFDPEAARDAWAKTCRFIESGQLP